jgi:hypothetical protein
MDGGRGVVIGHEKVLPNTGVARRSNVEIVVARWCKVLFVTIGSLEKCKAV